MNIEEVSSCLPSIYPGSGLQGHLSAGRSGTCIWRHRWGLLLVPLVFLPFFFHLKYTTFNVWWLAGKFSSSWGYHKAVFCLGYGEEPFCFSCCPIYICIAYVDILGGGWVHRVPVMFLCCAFSFMFLNDTLFHSFRQSLICCCVFILGF